MEVSFIVVAYNEEKTLSKVFDDLKSQTYPHSKIEIILVDGCSTDKTKSIMESFRENNTVFSRVVVKDNPKKTLPCGWNIALKEAHGDIILRIDAHATIPNDFIEKNVECIKSGEKICGGFRPNIIDEETPWKKTLLLAETSMFGSSVASYRRSGEKRYVKSVFHGAYCREVFDKVGFYNEELARTEDNEMHYRMREAGYKICFDPSIISYQHTRNTFKKMIKQKYLNGYWIGKTVKVCPKCFSIYHFVPGVFLIYLCILIINLLSINNILLNSPIILYCILNILNTIISNKNSLSKYNVFLPIIFFILHISYGIGTIRGILKKF